MENLTNYARSSRLTLVMAPRYMAVAFVWLYKGGSLSLHEFLQGRSVMNRFDSHEKAKIKKGTDPVNMDVTLLHKLLLHACDIPADNKEVHSSVREGQEPSLGRVLFQVKNIRNEKSHQDPEKLTQVSDKDLDALATELSRLLTLMLTLAGRESGQSRAEVTKVISNMKNDVEKERHAEGGITVDQFVVLGRQELLQKRQAPECSYVEPRLVVRTQDAFYSSVIYLSELFTCTFLDGSQPQVIQVTGEAGAGKTSLCQALMAWWLGKEHTAQAVAGFQLVLSVTCAEVKSRDLHRHLRTFTLPKTTHECDTASLTRVLREAKVLWLVDGWDEATGDARGFLEDLLHSKGESHTVLLTSRPEFSASLHHSLLREKVLKVSFAGLQDDERKQLVSRMNLPGVVNESLEKFFNVLRSFPTENMNNPLRLRRMAELWCFGHGFAEGRRSLSLVQINLYIIQWQRRDLIARCERDAAPGQDVAQKIDAWLKLLYELSFNSAKSGASLVLDEKSYQRLLKRCEVPSALCLSTFLGCSAGRDVSRRGAAVRFSHYSQRCVYAARHLECCCEDAADAEAKLREVLRVDSAELDDHVDPHLGVYDLVIQVLLMIKILLSRVTRGRICHEARQKDFKEALLRLRKKFVHLVKGNYLPAERWVKASSTKSQLAPILLQLMEMWAEGLFQARVSAKFLVDMLANLLEGDRDSGRWLEVVRRCGDNGDLVEEVSRKVSTKLWVINDDDVRAAAMLLQHVTPAEVMVIVAGDPKRLPHLQEFLSQLARCPVGLQLHIRSHYYVLGSKDFSDSYLELVCRQESKCTLNIFTGHLSARGLRLLAAAPEVTTLNLRITQHLAVHELTALTAKLKRLKVLNLMYDNAKFVVPHSSLDGSLGVMMVNGIKSILTFNGLRPLVVSLQLPHLRETSVNSAVNFISGLSKRYVTLTAGKVSERGVKNLVAGLENNAVRVRDLRIPIYVKEYQHHVFLSLGSLPIQIPLGHFLRVLYDCFQDPLGNIIMARP